MCYPEPRPHLVQKVPWGEDGLDVEAVPKELESDLNEPLVRLAL